jgi:hypothetical protein
MCSATEEKIQIKSRHDVASVSNYHRLLHILGLELHSIDTLNRLDIDEQQRDLSDIRTRRLDFRLKKLNAAKSRTHRILTMASDMLVRGLKHIEKLPGYVRFPVVGTV